MGQPAYLRAKRVQVPGGGWGIVCFPIYILRRRSVTPSFRIQKVVGSNPTGGLINMGNDLFSKRRIRFLTCFPLKKSAIGSDRGNSKIQKPLTEKLRKSERWSTDRFFAHRSCYFT